MIMKTYTDRLKAHLAEYKRVHLGTDKSGTWSHGNRILEYEHILAPDDAVLNILPSIRDAFWIYWERLQQSSRPPTLHRDFAHLNSSQAFAFNLFFPYLAGDPDDANLLLRSLGIHPEPIVEWEFEKILDDKERTNFDVWMRLESGVEVCVEVKLSESDFGMCVGTPGQRAKLESIYEPRLRRMIAAEHLEPSRFFRRYQILRNFMYAEPATRHVVFVFPRQNERLREGKRYIETVLQANREWVRCVQTESLLTALSREGDSRLTDHVNLLREKYVLTIPDEYPLPLTQPYTTEDYGDELATLVRANGGSPWISIAGLLPNPPEGLWTSVGDKLRGTGSAVRFLSYMFGDLTLPSARQAADTNPPIVIDGFLGCAGFAQSPWLLLPAIGTWLRSPVSIRDALRYLDDSLNAWREEGRALSTDVPTELAVASQLRPFVPDGKVPNARVVQEFVDEALGLVRLRANEK
jgi:hypothetical protein